MCWCVWGKGSGHSVSYLGDSDLYKTLVFTVCVERGGEEPLGKGGRRRRKMERKRRVD